MDIREALSKLDTMEDDHWTSSGDPKIDAVKDLLGRPVTRQEIVNAAPAFNRENPLIEDPQEEVVPDPALTDEVDTSIVDLIASEEPMRIEKFLQLMNEVPPEQLSALLEVLRVQEQATTDHQKRLEEMSHRIRQSAMHTKARLDRELPDIDNQTAIREYLESQQRTREAKHALTYSVLKNIDLKQLDPRAAIDRAMARKTQRGTNRPVHPSR